MHLDRVFAIWGAGRGETRKGQQEQFSHVGKTSGGRRAYIKYAIQQVTDITLSVVGEWATFAQWQPQ